MKSDVPSLIQRLPLNIVTRMKMERCYIKASKNIQGIGSPQKVKERSLFYPLVRSNRYYGHEFLLRRYSGECRDLYSIIEHGIYFGKNRQKVGLKHEWELGCILTNGKYRFELISSEFPDYYCECIGPMIYYAQNNDKFMDELKDRLLKEERILLFFPRHGSEAFNPEYDIENSIKGIITIAEELMCANIIISAYNLDAVLFNNVIASINSNKRIIVTSCGNRYDSLFLDKQKSMIELSDVTVSNGLGTHIGYSIYLNKPHILLPQEFSYSGDEKAIAEEFNKKNRSSNWSVDYADEERTFLNMFSEYRFEPTKDQYDFCDYYWGFGKVKSKKEISEIYDNCERLHKK